MRQNQVKCKLQAGEVAVVLSGVNDANTVDQLGVLGFDGFWFEAEHGAVDFGDVSDLTRACDLWGMSSLVRVHQNEPGVIYRTLDQGAMGVVVPHVNSREAAERMVDAGKFAPVGRRGMFLSRQGYGVHNYFEKANDESMLVALIEDISAVDCLDDILAVDHIDCFLVAPSDLAASMGKIGYPQAPEVQAVVDRALKQVIEAGRVAGTRVEDDTVERYVSMGVQLLMTSPGPWITAGARRLLSVARSA